MSDVTFAEAGARLGISPLEVVLRCAVRGFPCEAGYVDDGLLPILGTLREERPRFPTEATGPADDETEEDRRLRIVRRILERLNTMGKWYPARTEKRATARGLKGPDVGTALRAVEAMIDAGLMVAEQSGHEPRVGLNGDRRAEIADITAGRPIADERLRGWISHG